MKSIQISIVALLALMVVLAGYSQEPQDAEAEKLVLTTPKKSKWQLQVGAAYQWNRGMSVKGPSIAPSAGGRPNLSGVGGLTYPGNSALTPRDFDDGYVHPDIWTGDGGVPSERQGMTWNWGAQNASQYDYNGGNHPTLSYHLDRGESVGSAYNMNRGGSDDDFDAYGIEVKAKRLLHTWLRDDIDEDNLQPSDVMLEMSLVVGLAWFPSKTQNHRRSMGRSVYGMSETYTYLDYYGTTAGGSYPPLSVPYSGSYGQVGGSDAGPLIPGSPESAVLNSTYLGTARNTVDIKSRMWRLRSEAGLEFAKPITKRLNVYVAPQFVLEFVDMDVDRYERSSGPGANYSRSQGKHKMAVHPGVLLTAGVDYNVSENWYAGASAGYEWLFQDPYVRVGADKVTYDLNGGEVSLYIGRRF